jgi:hypothetical protein
MMQGEIASKILGFYPQLMWLTVQDDFIEFSQRESFKSYIPITYNRIKEKTLVKGRHSRY